MKKKVKIEGMSCMHCVAHVKDALNELKGVKEVDVNLSAGTAIIESTENITDDQIRAAIGDAGYEVLSITEP